MIADKSQKRENLLFIQNWKMFQVGDADYGTDDADYGADRGVGDADYEAYEADNNTNHESNDANHSLDKGLLMS